MMSGSISVLAKATVLLACCALVSRATVFEAAISGAGSRELNGLWRRIEDHNGAPQFELEKDGQAFELFYYSGGQDAGWWNIQEKVVENGTVVSYGKVYYAAPAYQEEPAELPASGWQSSAHYQKWVGSDPPPRVHVLGQCDSDLDCEPMDDECIEFFIDKADFEDFIVQQQPEDMMCNDPKWMRNISNAEIEEMREEFFSSGVVAIRDILLPEIAEEYIRNLRRNFHSGFWQASFWEENGGYAKLVPRSRENQELIEKKIAEQHARRQRNEYAYSFTRTSDMYHPKFRSFYRPFFKGVSEFLQSSQLQRVLTAVTDRKYELAVYFLSRYTSGDFLDRHSDSVETRKIAFTMHFTQDWRLEFGGLLMFLNSHNWDIAEKVAVPRYNTLTFFDVSKERRMLPHMVTEVVAGLERNRIAATGWMQYMDDTERFSYSQREGWRVE